MKKIIPYIVLLLMVASIAAPVGIGYAQEPYPVLEVVAGEFNIPEFSFTASPAKCVYEGNGTYNYWFTITSEEGGIFDIDGSQYKLASGITKCYKRLELTGQTERFTITKLIEEKENGIRVQESLILKIVPKS